GRHGGDHAGQAAVLGREVLADGVVAVQAGGVARDDQPAPAGVTADGPQDRLGDGAAVDRPLGADVDDVDVVEHRGVDALGAGREARQQPVADARDDDGDQPAVRRDADDADAVVHAAADRAGHLGAVRVAAAAQRAAVVELAALRARRLVRVEAWHDV